MKIEIIHGRDPDSECELTVFVDGERMDPAEVYIEDIDPGRGCLRSDWDENVEFVRTHPGITEPFREAALAELESYSGSPYIMED